VKSSLLPYFTKVRGTILPGAHRLQKLLTNYIPLGIFDFECILVTGSNGKGTTCAYLEKIFREHKFKTGLYTSPHLVHPTERIRINGIPISESILESNLKEVLKEVDTYLPDATFFEITTAISFLVFLKNKIDILICEVGLGGRYDSTNTLSPIISIITSISLEHTEFLGNTIESIAFDKAHIARRNRELIVPNLCHEAYAGINKACEKIGAKIVKSNNHINEIFHYNNDYNTNLNLALTTINSYSNLTGYTFQENLIHSAIQNTFWPGRFDIRIINNRTVIFDAAHNPDGFEFFLEKYNNSNFSDKKFVLLFASLSDKDWKHTITKFNLFSEKVIFTQVASKRTEDISAFIHEIESKKILLPNYEAYTDFKIAVKNSMRVLPHLPLVITGSIAFIGDVMEYLNVEVFSNNE
jgi:dihydrofolate synthase/folylpolyglutamate synthase